MKFFPISTAHGKSWPSASAAQIAAEYVQPVPCVEIPFTNGAESSNSVSPSKKMSAASVEFFKWPPFTKTAQPKREWIFRAAERKSSGDEIFCSARISASSRFGVTSAASGRSFSFRNFSAAGWNSRTPLVETITGSTTSFGFRISDFGFRKKFATTEMFLAENSIPVFTAAGFSSSNTASICWRSILGEHDPTAKTRRGFCAVRQAMALAPCTPNAAKVFKSA